MSRNLQVALEALNEALPQPGRAPNLTMVSAWVEEAGSLERGIEYRSSKS